MYCTSVCVVNVKPGLGCSNVPKSFVNILLKFQTLISEICQYFLLKKCYKSFSHFSTKISMCLVIKS